MYSDQAKLVRVQRERHYTAHHAFLSVAYRALKNAEAKENNQPYQPLICITFCGLGLEAVANAFGERLVDDWDDFETASPVVKLRTICSTIGVSWNAKEEPFATVMWLVKMRNKLAHAKPELIKTDDVMTEVEYEAQRDRWPTSKLERNLTVDNARRAMDQIHALLRLLMDKAGIENLDGLLADGFSGSAGPPT